MLTLQLRITNTFQQYFALLTFVLIGACQPVIKKFDGESINLSEKKLKTIPDSIFLHKDLVSLNLGCGSCIAPRYDGIGNLYPWVNNEIEVIPEKIRELKKLKELILNGNKLRSLPESLIELNELEVLDISMNKELNIDHEIEKIKRLPKLKTLKIYDVLGNIDSLKVILGNKVQVIHSSGKYFILPTPMS